MPSGLLLFLCRLFPTESGRHGVEVGEPFLREHTPLGRARRASALWLGGGTGVEKGALGSVPFPAPVPPPAIAVEELTVRTVGQPTSCPPS